MIIGYTTGVFDLFHIGHLNILKNAKSVCDKLIVGVTTDEYCMKYKLKSPFISFKDRANIVESIKYVDVVIPQFDHDKFEAWKKLKFNVMIVGDDWYSTKVWESYEKVFESVRVKIIYFPRTPGVSTTDIRANISE